MTSLRTTLASASLAIILGAPQAFGDTITFYNTGVADDGTVLAAGTADPHYSLIDSPAGPATATAIQQNEAWLVPSAGQGWIGPGGSGYTGWSGGDYVYETSVDLTGYDPTTALLSGTVSADDGVTIYLNGGGPVGFSGWSGYNASTAFSLSGFTSGVNRIDFVVTNQMGPTGLLVNGTLTAEPVAVTPEPSTLILVLSGCVACLVGVRRTPASFTQA